MHVWPGANQRNYWIDAVLALAIGVVAQTAIEVGLRGQLGMTGPVLGLLGPAAVGVIAGAVATRGSSVGGLAVGVIIAFQIAPLVSGPVAPDLITVALAATAAAVGYSITWGAKQQRQAAAFMPGPQSSADIGKLETELNARLRSLDPNAPGTFELASALLRQAGEQSMMFSPMGWAGSQTDSGHRSELSRIQAELVEIARVSALASGASRVTVSTTQMGIDIQAIWGEPPAEDTSKPREPGWTSEDAGLVDPRR